MQQNRFMLTEPWRPYPTSPPHTVVGDLFTWDEFPFPPARGRRRVWVLLPPSYGSAGSGGSGRRYPVLYMHDAQNLFDACAAFAGAEWQVDETMQALAREGLEAIVVAVDHADRERVREYTPFAGGRAYGRAYAAWLAECLKPAIDHQLRTLPGREQTFVAGSSLGGLISTFAFFAHPETFGGAAALSPAYWIAHGAIFDFVQQAPYRPGRLYLDHGTRESVAILPMVRLLQEKGYRAGEELLYLKEPGARHTEAAWARRLPAALRFLLRDARSP